MGTGNDLPPPCKGFTKDTQTYRLSLKESALKDRNTEIM
jgi:hypothetical protein